ncbi:MAG: Ig domain-containing protein [Verrucomicrobiales bacterium]
MRKRKFHHLLLILLVSGISWGQLVSGELADALDHPKLSVTTGWQGSWTPQVEEKHMGINALASGPVEHGRRALLDLIVTGPDQLGFWWKVSSERNRDILAVRTGAAVLHEISGEVDWELRFIDIPAGEHRIRWEYLKDELGSEGQDKAWLDSVFLVSETDVAPAIQLPERLLARTDTPFQLSIEAETPVDRIEAVGLPEGLTVEGMKIVGTPVNLGRFLVTITAFNNQASTSAEMLLTVGGPVRDGIDFYEGTDLFLAPTWYNQTEISHDGFDAAEVRDVNNGGESSFAFTIKGPGIFGFWWRTEGSSSMLRVRDHGTEEAHISGTTDWRYQQIVIQPGIRLIDWQYERPTWIPDGGAWIDGVTFTEGGPSLLFTSDTVNQGQVGSFSQWPLTTSPSESSITVLQLPDGLSFNATSGVISGIPTSDGVFDATATATAGAASATISIRFEIAKAPPPVDPPVIPSASQISGALDAGAQSFEWSRSPPAVQTITTSDGVDALQFGGPDRPAGGRLTTIVQGPDVVTFWWHGSENGSLSFYVDGEAVQSTANQGWQKVSVPLPTPRQHEISWLHSEPGQGDSMAAWLDQFALQSITEELPPFVPISGPIDLAVGVAFSHQLEFAGEPSFAIVDAPAWVKIVESNGRLFGTPPELGEFTALVRATNNVGGLDIPITLHVFPDFAEALGTTGVDWTTATAANDYWHTQPDTEKEGNLIASVGPVRPERMAWLATSIVGPDLLSFRWRASGPSPQNLSLLVDDEEVTQFSGNAGQWDTVQISIPEGTHKVAWTYQEGDYRGAGTASLDDVRIGAAHPIPLIAAIASPLLVTQVDPVNLAIQATAQPTLYEAIGLPLGLTIGPSTGHITGIAQMTGEFRVTITASNGEGAASMDFAMIVEPTLSDALGVHLDWIASPAESWQPIRGSDGGLAVAPVGPHPSPDQTRLEATVQGPDRLLFRAEYSGLGLRVLLDGEPQSTVRPRLRSTGFLDIPAGKHSIGWGFEANHASSEAVIDDVVLVSQLKGPYIEPMDLYATAGVDNRLRVAQHGAEQVDVTGLPEGMTFDPATMGIIGSPRWIGTEDLRVRAHTGEQTFETVIRLHVSPALDRIFANAPFSSITTPGESGWWLGNNDTGFEFARSGGRPNDESWLEITMEGPDELDFVWNGSGSMIELNYVPLPFFRPSTWQRKQVFIPEGRHTIRWFCDSRSASTGACILRDVISAQAIGRPIMVAPEIFFGIADVPFEYPLTALNPVEEWKVRWVGPQIPGVETSTEPPFVRGQSGISGGRILLSAKNANGTDSQESRLIIGPQIKAAPIALGIEGLIWGESFEGNWARGRADGTNYLTSKDPSTLFTAVEGPGTISFDWRASSGWIELLVNGRERARVYGDQLGDTHWHSESIDLPPGRSNIYWSAPQGRNSRIRNVRLTGYADWLLTQPDLAERAMHDDPDRDGVSNFTEFALGYPPTEFTPWNPVVRYENGVHTIEFKADLQPGIELIVEQSASLLPEDWAPVADGSIVTTDDGTIRVETPMTEETENHYLRIRLVSE